jgi:hypothetical protein
MAKHMIELDGVKIDLDAAVPGLGGVRWRDATRDRSTTRGGAWQV